MSANDRGTIKWTSLMLPEHVNLLNAMWKEDEYKEKPILDEQKLIEIDGKLQCAIHNDLTVVIKYILRFAAIIPKKEKSLRLIHGTENCN